jgi:probable HAF family extracellular repeat protein
MKLTGLHLVLVIAFTLLLSACDMGGTPTVPKIIRLEITPGGLLLTKAGESQVLSVKAFDAENHEAPASITWTSSNPANATVDSSGKVTAASDLGSAQLTAQAGDAKAMILVVIAQTVPGAVLVKDNQITKIELIDPNAAYQVGYQYKVNLLGVTPPAVGSILLSSESYPVAGKVVAVSENAGVNVVILEVVPLGQVFSNVAISEVLDLSAVKPEIAQTTKEFFIVEYKSPGHYTLTLKPGQVLKTTSKTVQQKRLSPRGAFKLGPLDCESSLKESEVAFDKATVDIDFSQMQFEFKLFDNEKRILIEGQPKVTFAFKPKISVALTGKIGCKLEFFEIPVPISGPLSAFASASIPVGAGIEIEGKIPVADVGFEATSEYSPSIRAGLLCHPDCSFLKEYTESSPKADYKFNTSNFLTGLKFEASISAFFYADINFGVGTVFKNLAGLVTGTGIVDLNFFNLQAGLKLETKLASEETQVADTTYASDHKLSFEASFATGADLTAALKKLDLLVTKLEFKTSKELGSSPTATTTVDKTNFKTGDTLNFKVKLTNLEFPLVGYNIESVRIYRKETIPKEALVFAREVVAAPGQSEFEMPWVATVDGEVKDNFFVFVKTNFLSDYRLEMGAVTPSCGAIRSAKYNITDLGTDVRSVIGFNDVGQILVDKLDALNHAHYFIWECGKLTELNLGGGLVSILDLNNLGQVLGNFRSGDSKAFIWQWDELTQKEKITNLGTLGGDASIATDFNDAGQVVGYSEKVKGSEENYGFLWQNGSMTVLSGTSVSPNFINNSGQIIFNWNTINGQNLGALSPGANTYATALNNVGQVVGKSGERGFIWQNGQMTDLGTGIDGKPLTPVSINDAGVVAVYSASSALLWQNGIVTDLNTTIDPLLGWVLKGGGKINNQGQIVITGLHAGEFHTVLLTPVQTQ